MNGRTNVGFPTREECVVADVLEARARTTPEKIYAVFRDDEWSFQEMAERAWRFANGLIREGVKPGEWVSMWLPSGPELLQAWYGINSAGAIFAPLNLAARGSFLEHAINVATPRVLIAHPQLLDRLIGLNLPTLELVIVAGAVPDGLSLPWRTLQFADVTKGTEPTRPVLDAPTEPWDDIALIYTSGTTGPSKGVRVSYASHWLFANSLVWPDVGADDRYLMALPMFHAGGTVTTYAMLQRGGSVALLGAFDPPTFWQDVRGFGITATVIIHAMVEFLLSQPALANDADNPLRIAYMGPLSHVNEFSRRFGVSIYTAFGMTEVPCPIRSELNPRNEKALGVLLHPDLEVRLVDEHDIPVLVGQPGELTVRHRLPWVINTGYKDMPEATVRAWRNGWFHTGDQLREDETGNYYFLDRVKDSIRRRGENISSFEVEAEVLTHPLVKECAAVAVDNPDVGQDTGDEEIKLVVVREAGAEITAHELAQYLIPRMPRHMVPRFIEFIDELPKTPSFKVMKADLRAKGITEATWDREKAGLKLKREHLV